MKKVIIFPSESTIVVSLVKYPTTVRSGPTVINKTEKKMWKKVSVLV